MKTSVILPLTALMAATVLTACGSAQATEERTGLHHPCDINQDAAVSDDTERLCLTVWDQDAYTITHGDGSSTETPAGPVVITELVSEWLMEDGPGDTSYLVSGLQAHRDDYARRD
ncbi:hypothetical protein [Rhodococcus qingshengii]|uniref:hypothetical protein n=1 Tax=Rhodococcus qingshengii TaxID=334542 RepID=UPI0035DE2A30